VAALTALLAATTLPVAAQAALALRPAPAEGRLAFRTYGSEQGLRHRSITALAQDARGFIWAGTEGGAYRYDGTGFTLFSLGHGLPSAWVRALLPEPDGGMWIGTREGLCCFQGGRVVPAEGAAARARIHQLVRGPGGRAWFVSDEGVFRRTRKLAFEAAPGWEGGRPLALHAAGNLVWVGTEEGALWRFENGDWTRYGTADGLAHGPVKAILLDGAGRLWVRTPRALLVRESEAARFRAVEGMPPLLNTLYEESLASDGEGGLLAPTNAGLLRIAQNGAWSLLDERRGLPFHWANAALVDRSGVLWVSNLGLNRRLGNGAWTGATKADGLPSDNVWAIRRDRAGVLWVASSAGLARARGAAFEAVPGLGGVVLYSLAEGPDGSLWCGGESAELFRLRPGGGAWERVPLPGPGGGRTTYGLAFTPDGTLWIATRAGLFNQPPGGGIQPAQSPFPQEGEVRDLAVDREGALWTVGDHGLARLKDGKWRRWGTEQGLRQPRVGTLAVMPGGDVWIGYQEPVGLTRLRPAGGDLRVVEHRDLASGLISNSIVSLLPEAAGALWIGTNEGVMRLEAGGLRHFTREDGLGGEDCNPYSHFAEPGGDFWIGTTSGLQHYRPDRAGAVAGPPKVELASVEAGNRRWEDPASEDGGNLGALAFSNRYVAIRFAVTDYRLDRASVVQARLVGLDDQWRGVRERELRYPALDPGSYRFEARAIGPDGRLGPVAAVSFRVEAPWWRTRWAWTLWTLLGGGFAWWLIRWRLQSLKARNEELERLVYQRTVALELSNEALLAMSMNDPLTGLKNRRFVDVTLPQRAAQSQRAHRTAMRTGVELPQDSKLLFAMLDLDFFKQVNDTFGHAAGDQVLLQTKDILEAHMRDVDIVARWGGEEFLVVANTRDLESAARLVARIHLAVRQFPYRVADREERISCSMGFVVFPLLPDHPDAFGWEDAVAWADRCLYAAKRSGRDGWVGLAADPGLDPEATAAEMTQAGGPGGASGLAILTSFDPAPIKWD
jgi:diguanylate cyclase (GGDEF)-like protein